MAPTGEVDVNLEENKIDLKPSRKTQLAELGMDDLLEWAKEVKL